MSILFDWLYDQHQRNWFTAGTLATP